MDFHSQKDLFNTHRHQAIRNLFIEKRKLLGLSQKELATQMQIDVSNIIKMESFPGDFKYSDIQLFSDALRVSIKELEHLLKSS
jgi:predicted transcriptional regulator|tara:strand:- start:298 stop:549 length:252 start_codon:yes stop_codon:yes gene_type:complete